MLIARGNGILVRKHSNCTSRSGFFGPGMISPNRWAHASPSRPLARKAARQTSAAVEGWRKQSRQARLLRSCPDLRTSDHCSEEISRWRKDVPPALRSACEVLERAKATLRRRVRPPPRKRRLRNPSTPWRVPSVPSRGGRQTAARAERPARTTNSSPPIAPASRRPRTTLRQTRKRKTQAPSPPAATRTAARSCSDRASGCARPARLRWWTRPRPMDLGLASGSHASAQCSATKKNPAPVCGSAQGQPLAEAPSGAALCAQGTASAPSLSDAQWKWTCSKDGGTAKCRAARDNVDAAPTTAVERHRRAGQRHKKLGAPSVGCYNQWSCLWLAACITPAGRRTAFLTAE